MRPSIGNIALALSAVSAHIPDAILSHTSEGVWVEDDRIRRLPQDAVKLIELCRCEISGNRVTFTYL